MPYDLKIVQLGTQGTIVGGTWPNPDFVEGEYNLVQRIVKNLMTNPGEDLFDPDWGSGIRSRLLGIPGNEVARAQNEASIAIVKCRQDVQEAMGGSNDPAEKLLDLRLSSIEYDQSRAAWSCIVVMTTEANVDIPVSLAL
jgi:hypothetical protein